jgi:hypothetical protein
VNIYRREHVEENHTMNFWNPKPQADCKYDLIALGEVMIRLDPGDERIHTARHFQVWEGGGEYNVARGLKRCFGKMTAIVTAIPECPVGRLLGAFQQVFAASKGPATAVAGEIGTAGTSWKTY